MIVDAYKNMPKKGTSDVYLEDRKAIGSIHTCIESSFEHLSHERLHNPLHFLLLFQLQLHNSGIVIRLSVCTGTYLNFFRIYTTALGIDPFPWADSAIHWYNPNTDFRPD